MDKKRKLYIENEDKEEEMPEKYRHIRSSERKVREDVYQTFAALSGQGLSLDECSSAIKMVGNVMFGRTWIKAGESKTISKDSLRRWL